LQSWLKLTLKFVLKFLGEDREGQLRYIIENVKYFEALFGLNHEADVELRLVDAELFVEDLPYLFVQHGAIRPHRRCQHDVPQGISLHFFERICSIVNHFLVGCSLYELEKVGVDVVEELKRERFHVPERPRRD